MSIATVLNRAESGASLSVADAETLLGATDPDDRAAIFAAANAFKEKLWGDRVTYVVNLNLNFTNICELHCTFCAFRRNAGERDAYAHAIDEVVEKVGKYRRSHDISEVTIQGGINPNLPVSYYFDLMRELKRAFPEIHLHAYSPQEIAHIQEVSGRSLPSIFEELKAAGHGSLCGTAAELLVEPVRSRICPEKISASRWLEIVGTAHRTGTPSTSTMMFGHLEALNDRARHLDILRNLQHETGGFTEFIPLPFIAPVAPLGRATARREPADEDVLLMVAVARLFFGAAIPHVQLGWVKRGVAMAARSLRCGADDIGGTLLEEEISNRAGSAFGAYTSATDLAATVFKEGLVPARRNTLYEVSEKRDQVSGIRDQVFTR